IDDVTTLPGESVTTCLSQLQGDAERADEGNCEHAWVEIRRELAASPCSVEDLGYPFDARDDGAFLVRLEQIRMSGCLTRESHEQLGGGPCFAAIEPLGKDVELGLQVPEIGHGWPGGNGGQRLDDQSLRVGPAEIDRGLADLGAPSAAGHAEAVDAD